MEQFGIKIKIKLNPIINLEESKQSRIRISFLFDSGLSFTTLSVKIRRC